MRILASLVSCLMGLALVGPMAAQAQNWPTGPVKIIVPFPAGGSADTLARTLGQAMQEATGQSFVVENRTGAGGNIGTAEVARAAPDGSTILLTPSSVAIAPVLYAKPGYDPVKDFAPVTLVGNIPMVVVVHPSLPVKTMSDLVVLAKSKPGEISYASAGFGTTNHLAFELFMAQTGTNFVHVPYRGNPLAVVDVIAGQVPVFFDFVLTGRPHVQAGSVRALATTGAKRSGVLPDVPTAMEAGMKDFEASTWFGVYAPAATPKPVIDRMNAVFAAALAATTVRERFSGLGVDPMPLGPDTLAQLTRDDLAKWAPIIQKAGIKPQ
jgi:tripartite-type tricarboxylate transporter receptor subunit TctC